MMVLPGGMLVGDHWDGGDGLARLGIMAREMRFMWANLGLERSERRMEGTSNRCWQWISWRSLGTHGGRTARRSHLTVA